jgi:hypothetical protein
VTDDDVTALIPLEEWDGDPFGCAVSIIGAAARMALIHMGAMNDTECDRLRIILQMCE